MKKSGKRNRIAWLESEARKFALSGHYQGFAAIQAALLERGFAEVVSSTLFQNRWTCSELDRLCERAQRGRISVYVKKYDQSRNHQ
jgi:hypothetical protein